MAWSIEKLAIEHGFGSYQGYLESKHWERLKRSKRPSETGCCVCDTKSVSLVCHHVRYRNLIDVVPEDLEVMCHPCHDVFHLGCRITGQSYIGLHAPQIKALTLSFKDTEWFKKRAKKLELRKAVKVNPRLKQKSKRKGKKKHQKRAWKRMQKRLVEAVQQKKRFRMLKREGSFLNDKGRLIYAPQ